MSIATAKQFLQKVQNEQALSSRMRGTLAHAVRIAAAEGFVFTAGEYESALKEQLTQHAAGLLGAELPVQVVARPIAGELSEKDLELVAGGTSQVNIETQLPKALTVISDGAVKD